MKVTEATMKDLHLMSTYIGNIQSNKSLETNIRGIERIIGRVFDLNVKINIVDNNSGKFFGMTVTPETMDRILLAILEERSNKDKLYEIWREEKNWVIEIDDLLLYDKNLNANPREIVAVLLHELGHVVYSNEAVSRANRVIKMTLLESGMKYKKVFSHDIFRPLLSLPLYESCSTKHFRIPKDINSEEYIADKFVLVYGHGDSLSSFINKLIKTHGNGLIERQSDDMDKDVEILVKWTVQNVQSLEFRKTKLRQALRLEEQRNPSTVIKTCVKDIRERIFGKHDETETIKAVMKEQYLFESLTSILESSTLPTQTKQSYSKGITGLVKQSKLKKIDIKELDILEVDIERIQYHDDKIYLLELIYELDDRVTYYIDLIDTGSGDKVPQTKQSLLVLQKRIAEMRMRVLTLQIGNPHYGLFVKYPNGYEG